MTFVRPTLSDLVERARGDIESRLPGADSRLRHSVLDVLARMHAGATAGLYGYLDNLAGELMLDTASAWLDRHASVWGILRKAATAVRATVTATGINGSAIPIGAEMQRSDGRLYRVLAAATIAAGIAGVEIEAEDAGAQADLQPGMALTFTSPVAGVNAGLVVASVTNAGADEESDDQLRARLLDRVRQPPQGGTANDYVQWALAQPGVTRAWSYPQWMGLGTIGVTFVMDERADPIPLAGDVAAVQTALDLLRPVTAELFVFAPTSRPVDLTLRISPDTADLRAAIVAELDDFIARDAQPGATLYRSRISEAISQTVGEFWHEIVFPYGDEVAGPGELLTLGTVSFVA